MTEREKMLRGELYRASDEELVAMRRRARTLVRAFNDATPEADDVRAELLGRLLGRVGPGAFVEPPLRVDYGVNTSVGRNFYANFNLVLLDCALIEIGDDALVGPNVQLIAATHPVEAAERVKGPELAKPIRIGHRVWLGAGAIVCPGVTIGDDTTIGAGSVVVKDIPAGVVAAGNPCRVIREIEPSARQKP